MTIHSIIDDNESKALSGIVTIEKDEGKSSDARLRHKMLVDLMEEIFQNMIMRKL